MPIPLFVILREQPKCSVPGDAIHVFGGSVAHLSRSLLFFAEYGTTQSRERDRIPKKNLALGQSTAAINSEITGISSSWSGSERIPNAYG
jgi:hypothetical protein